MGFAEAGLERLWMGGVKAEEFRNLNTEESQNLASMTIWGLINKLNLSTTYNSLKNLN